jgi:hypothetical protein
VTRFTDHLYIRLVSTSNYSATANPNNSQIITTPAVLQPAVSSPAVAWQRLLTMEILHSLKSSFHRLPYRTTDFQLTLSLVTFLHGPRINTPFPLLQPNCCIIKNLLPSSGTVFTEPWPRNGSGISAHLAVVA